MNISSLTPEQLAAVTSRKTADETTQECLDRHTLAMVESWVATDVGAQARELYARLLAAPANVRDAIFAQANQALG